MKKIRFISQCFFWLFIIIFIAMPILSVVFWIHAPDLLYLANKSLGFSINEIPKGIDILHTLSATTKLLAFTVDLIPLILNMLVVYFLIRLFALFKKGELFSLNNVICIKRTGIFLLVGQLVNPFYEAAISAVLTYGNPPGHRYAAATLSGTNIGIILVSILIILISWIMAEGCKLQEEQRLTV